jgi:serine/threonine-protein kinase HipA
MDGRRIPLLSAMAFLGMKDGQVGSYPEIVDVFARHGAQAKKDAHALHRRVAFNVLVSNEDDHLRNHGFLQIDKSGWTLSPAYDLNPVPADLKARILSTNIDLEESTCSIDLLEASADYFALSLTEARSILKQVAVATSSWRTVALEFGASSKEIDRRASAFELDALMRALALP